MENLDKLRNLSYLILSFNKIDKIEGLNELKQLEKL
jgi:Leucine-rich repeat (LRR) protein